jgi:hypothetical protein
LWERGWGFHHPGPDGEKAAAGSSELEDLRRRVAELENSLKAGGR